MKLRSFFCTIAVLLGGCASNNFTSSYQVQSRDAKEGVPPTNLEPTGRESFVLSSKNLPRDTAELSRRGYVILGKSKFTAEEYDFASDLATQAKQVGADIVLLSIELKDIESVTKTIYNDRSTPGRPSPMTPTAIPGAVTAVISGIPHYTFTAIYWRKTKPKGPGP